MVEEVNNEPQEMSEMLFSLSEPIRKMPHKIPPLKREKRKFKIKSDPKPYFEDDHLENLRANSFRQGVDDAHMVVVMRSMGIIYLSPNMSKTNSKPIGKRRSRASFLEFAQ